MSKQVFAPHPAVPLSAAVRAGDFIYLSGQVPFGADGLVVHGDIAAQTRQVLDNLAGALAQAGAANVAAETKSRLDPELVKLLDEETVKLGL